MAGDNALLQKKPYNPLMGQTPGAYGNNPMAMDTGGQPIPPAPHWVNSLMGLGQSAVNGFMAPSNALMGKYDQIVVGPDGEVISMFDPRMIEDANAMAGLVTTGALPIPKPAGALGIFGGTMAKTADMAALAQAEKLAASGANRDEIWNATGWFKGADDKWRFEIPDNRTFFKGDGTAKQLAERWGGTVGGAYRHPTLWEAYPELANAQLRGKNQMNALGTYIGPQLGEDAGRITLNNAMQHQQMNSVALHELQHGVQDLEGFANGGSTSLRLAGLPDYADVADAQTLAAFVRKGSSIEEAPSAFLNATGRDASPAARVLLREYADNPEALYSMPATAQEAYKRLAGEVEARNVQTRMDMTPEQRRAKAPWLTQDVPDNLQIVRANQDVVNKLFQESQAPKIHTLHGWTGS